MDVLAQRWSALDYFLTKQMQEPSVPIAKVWASLKISELEPPVAITTIQPERLRAAQATAAMVTKLFGGLASKTKD